MKQQTTTPKTAVVTLKANGSTMQLLATLKADGTVVTKVTTWDESKKPVRGMTEVFKDMDSAKAHLAALAKKAEGLGWQRGTRAVAAKADAFSKLPAAPKVEVK